MTDSVNHPSHYNTLPAICDKCGDQIECIEVVRHKDFNTGNAMKYLWRAGLKHDNNQSPTEAAIQDLKKAIFYIEDEIKLLEKEKIAKSGS